MQLMSSVILLHRKNEVQRSFLCSIPRQNMADRYWLLFCAPRLRNGQAKDVREEVTGYESEKEGEGKGKRSVTFYTCLTHPLPLAETRNVPGLLEWWCLPRSPEKQEIFLPKRRRRCPLRSASARFVFPDDLPQVLSLFSVTTKQERKQDCSSKENTCLANDFPSTERWSCWSAAS